MTVDLGFEGLGRCVSSFQIGNQPSLHFTRFVHVSEEQVKSAHQSSIACLEFTLNGNGQGLQMTPQRNGHLFVGKVFGIDVIQEQDNAAPLLLLGFAPLGIFPVRASRRGHEHLLFFIPTCLEEAFSLKREPTRFAVVPSCQIHVQQVFDGGVNSRT